MLFLTAAFAASAAAQELEISVSPSPVGSGARAAGMADAFVAIADDATAAAWNPAGLVQLERPEIAIVGAFNRVHDTFGAPGQPEVESRHSAHNLDLNFLSVTYPLPFVVLDRNVVAGLYYQHKYDFTRTFSLDYGWPSFAGRGWVVNQFQRLEFDQEGALSTVTPALAFELTHRLSIGVGLNLWRSTPFSENGWTQRQRTRYSAISAIGSSFVLGDFSEKYKDVRGESLTVGVLWNPLPRWTLGLRYDSAWTATAGYERRGWSWRGDASPGQLRPFAWAPRRTTEKRKIRFPATWALGAACRINDRWTVSADLSRTDWSDFWQRKPGGPRRSLINNASMDDLLFPARFDPTYTFRCGAEYVMIPKQPDTTLDWLWTLRGGFVYDQEPASQKPDDFYGIALGVGLLAKQRVNIDLAYQVRIGRGVNADFIRGIRGFEENVVQHRLLASTVIYF